MDPALQELYEGNPLDEVEVLVKAGDYSRFGDDLRIVARFGEIASCRIKRGDIERTWKQSECLKAPRYISQDPSMEVSSFGSSNVLHEEEYLHLEGEIHRDEPKTVIAVLDWGFDFTHPHLRYPDGSTKFLSIWDQESDFDGKNKYGYGRVISRVEINKALKTSRPFESLGYHPDAKGRFRFGSHGTHVAGITTKIAPTHPLMGVNLSTGKIAGTSSLGDSVRIVEALDYVRESVGERPCSINMSVGSMGGCHTGESLVEQCIDYTLLHKKGIAVCQSAGNYYASKTHSQGAVTKNKSKTLIWRVERADRTPNELEVWYNKNDDFIIKLTPPNDGNPIEVVFPERISHNLTEKSIDDISIKKNIKVDGIGVVGRIYHRKKDSTTDLNHIDIFLYTNAPHGNWELELIGKEVYSGEFHAWIERDGNQSTFGEGLYTPYHTTGTIANSKFGIAVGAYNKYDSTNPIASFSSAGRVLDKDRRIKPEIIAPGESILAAKSASKDEHSSRGNAETRKSGTSMAAPHVCGAIALLFEQIDFSLEIKETRQLLFQSADPYENDEEIPERYGHGILNISKLIQNGKKYNQIHIQGITRKIDHFQEKSDEINIDGSSSNLDDLGQEILVKEEYALFDNREVSQNIISETKKKQVWVRRNSILENLIEKFENKSFRINSVLEEIAQEIYSNGEEVEYSEFDTTSILTSIFTNSASNFLSELFSFVAFPGKKLEKKIQKGDILIRLGPSGELQQSLIVDPEPNEFDPDFLESALNGSFVSVIEKAENNGFSKRLKRLADVSGFLPQRQLIIRPNVDLEEEGNLSIETTGELQMRITQELKKQVSSTDRDAQKKRINNLKNIFRRTPRRLSLKLFAEINTRRRGNRFNDLFYGKLASPSRELLLCVLLGRTYSLEAGLFSKMGLRNKIIKQSEYCTIMQKAHRSFKLIRKMEKWPMLDTDSVAQWKEDVNSFFVAAQNLRTNEIAPNEVGNSRAEGLSIIQRVDENLMGLVRKYESWPDILLRQGRGQAELEIKPRTIRIHKGEAARIRVKSNKEIERIDLIFIRKKEEESTNRSIIIRKGYTHRPAIWDGTWDNARTFPLDHDKSYRLMVFAKFADGSKIEFADYIRVLNPRGLTVRPRTRSGAPLVELKIEGSTLILKDQVGSSTSNQRTITLTRENINSSLATGKYQILKGAVQFAKPQNGIWSYGNGDPERNWGLMRIKFLLGNKPYFIHLKSSSSPLQNSIAIARNSEAAFNQMIAVINAMTQNSLPLIIR